MEFPYFGTSSDFFLHIEPLEQNGTERIRLSSLAYITSA